MFTLMFLSLLVQMLFHQDITCVHVEVSAPVYSEVLFLQDVTCVVNIEVSVSVCSGMLFLQNFTCVHIEVSVPDIISPARQLRSR